MSDAARTLGIRHDVVVSLVPQSLDRTPERPQAMTPDRTPIRIATEQAKKARTATEQRDYWICEASREGSSLRAIGRATGLSHTAVKKILERAV